MTTPAEETFLTSSSNATTCSDAELEILQNIIPRKAKKANPLLNLKVMCGMMFAMTLVIVTGLFLVRASPAQTSVFNPVDVETLAEERVPAFKQCGGKGHAPKKCEAGCICHPQNEYFHICSAPEGRSQCDVAAAKAEEAKAKKKAAPGLAILKKKVAVQEATAKAYAQAAKEFNEAKATADKAAKVKAEKGKAADQKAAAKIHAMEENAQKVEYAADAAKAKFEKMVTETKKEAHEQEAKQNLLSAKRLNATLIESANSKKLARTTEKKKEAAAKATYKETLELLEREEAEAKKKLNETLQQAKEDMQEKMASAEQAAQEAKKTEKIAESNYANAAQAKLMKAQQKLKQAQEAAHVNVSKALKEEKQVKAVAAKQKKEVLAAVTKVANETAAKANAAKAVADEKKAAKAKAAKEANTAKDNVKDLAADVKKWTDSLV